jgi:hypothetical protein
MTRQDATLKCKEILKEYKLDHWHVVLSMDANLSWVGLCDFKSQTIILSAIAIDVHPDSEVLDTIRHEVAHAIVGPKHGHDGVWKEMALKLGASPNPTCAIGIDPRILDAIRSGNIVEVEMVDKTITRKVEEIVKVPKYTVTRLQERCPECGAVAKEKFFLETINKSGDTVRLITLECFHIITKVIPRGTQFESLVSNGWRDDVKNCKHEFLSKDIAKQRNWPINKCTKCGEFKLLPFQIVGAKCMESGLSMQKGFGLFDDMGLGKTVQSLAVIKFHKEYSPTLYVVKSSIKFQWFKEIVRWLSPDYLPQIIQTSRDVLIPGLKSYIISYDLLKRFNKEKLAKIGIKLVILDECQQIKNADSTRTQAIRQFVGSDVTIKVVGSSGTPWKNRGNEFFPILNMIDPIKFHSNQAFIDEWVAYYYHGNKEKMGGIKNVEKFREYTKDILIRREYNEVMDEFPDINRMKLPVQLDELSQSAYDESVSDFVKWYNDAVISGEEDNLNSINILAKMSRMRHITGLAKIPATLGFVEEFVEDTDKKLVVFVHHVDVGQLMIAALTDTNKATNPDYYELAVQLKAEHIKVMKLTSEFSDGERFTIGEEFNSHKRVIMIASTQASGEGVNLQTCHDSVMHERQWNPQNEDQATPGRFRRIGQTAGVINITYPEAEATIDEHLDFIVETKRREFHASMNKSEQPQWNESDFAKELAQLIVNKHKERNKHKPKSEVSLTAAAKL